MTISNDILTHRQQMFEKRLNDLKRISAPQMIIDNAAKSAAQPGFKTLDETFDVEFATREVKTGRGGVQYLVYHTADGRSASYFPNAKYGSFIKWDE